MKKLINLAVVVLTLTSFFAIAVERSGAAEQKKPGYAYVAALSREPFHKPSCQWARKIAAKNLETFKTRDDAIKAGHRPCKVCKP